MQSKDGILLNQRKYALQLIADTGLSGAKPVNTPLEVNIKLTIIEYDKLTRTDVDDPILKDITRYQVRRLLYIKLATTLAWPHLTFLYSNLCVHK